MKQPYVSTLISQNFTSEEKALARDNIEAISSADLDGYVKSEDLEEYVTSGELSSYATTEYVDQSVSGFITSADLPDMTDVATKSWVSDQNYLTSVPSQYVTEDELTSAVSGKADRSEIPDVSDFTTHSEVDAAIQSATSGKMDQSESANFYPRYSNPEGYLTSIPYQYVTDTEMRAYVSDQTSAFITSADIPPIPQDVVTSAELSSVSGDIVAQIPSLAGYATEQYVNDATSAFVTQIDIDEATSGKMDKSQSAEFYPMATNPSGYLTEHQSLAGYATEQYVQDYTSAFITSADLPDLSDMATQTWVTNQHYITSADVPAQVEYSAGANIDITSHVVSVTDTSQILAGDNISITASGDDYVISAQVPSVSAFVTEQEMNDSIQSATSAFITSADIPAQQQADWTEADSGAVDYIKNKPTIFGIDQGRGISITTNSSAMVISTSDEYVNSAFVLSSIQSATSGLVYDPSYVHTDNNFTSALKDKLDSVEYGATQVTVLSTSSQLQPLSISGHVLKMHWGDGLACEASSLDPSHGVLVVNPSITNKLDGIEAGAQVNVQADWSQANSAADDYIKNKPFTGSLEAESPLYFTDESSGSTIHIDTSALVPSGTGSDKYLALEYGEPTWKECTRNVYCADIPGLTRITSADIANGYKDIPINMFSGENKGARNFIWSMDIKEAYLIHNNTVYSLVGVVDKIKTSTFYESDWYDYTNGEVADPYGVLFDNILESDLAKGVSHSYLAKPIHMIGGTGGAITTYGASLRVVFKTPLAVVEDDRIAFLGRIYAVRCDAQW